MSKLKIITVVGARPQFIKAAAVSRAISSHFSDKIEEKIIHTGQHFDENMSQVFFDELGVPKPHYNLAISGGSHGAMTGRMLEGIEQVLLNEKPDWLLIYGDTNSTLAGALAAAKLHIPIAHVEAGLRSFNMRMPEEINRIVSDRISTLLFCPTETAVQNLKAEGITRGAINVGDVMYDVALYYKNRGVQSSNILERLNLLGKNFILATCHRAENTDDIIRLTNIIEALAQLAKSKPVVLPLHPRTKKLLADFGMENKLGSILCVDPLPFLDMVALEQSAKIIMTDSGSVQKEAFFYGVPCITMREETEWVETVDLGWNILVGASKEKILEAENSFLNEDLKKTIILPYGNGDASIGIIKNLLQH
nr:UDP-N-acetylglucosamine 2-epimerase (non-hydrolyzing) [Polynucleobacter necessarius]